MIRIKVNLLPKEVKDKRTEEKVIVLAFLGMIAVAGLLGTVYAFNSWQLKMTEGQVTMLREQTSKMHEVIQSLRVYEQRQQEIQHKQQVVAKAVSGHVSWSKMLEELMILTPNDVSLTSLSGNADGITFSGEVLDPGDSPDLGHKPVARWLIKLSDIDPEPDVWLVASDKQDGKIVFNNSVKFKKTPTQPAPPTATVK